MLRVRSFPLGFTLALFLTIGGTAAAEPVVIRSGEITVGGVEDLFSRGFLRSIFFDFATDYFEVRGGTSDGVPQRPLEPLFPSPVTLIMEGGAPELTGLRGIMFVNATPSMTPTPFEMSGRFTFVDLSTGESATSWPLFGRGTATFRFVPTPTGGSVVSGVTYEFNDTPVPEPATLILVGAGLAGVLARRRTARRG